MRKTKRLNGRRGFTLIELIVALIIIGILSTIAAPMMQGIQRKAILSEAIVGLSAVRESLREYHVEYGDYPPLEGGMYISRLGNVLPGLKIRPSVENGGECGQSSLDGTYFSQETYTVGYGSKTENKWTGPIEIRCLVATDGIYPVNYAVRHDEVERLFPPPDPAAFIEMDADSGLIHQYRLSRYCDYPAWNPLIVEPGVE